MTARYQWELKYETNRIKQSREIGTPLKIQGLFKTVPTLSMGEKVQQTSPKVQFKPKIYKRQTDHDGKETRK